MPKEYSNLGFFVVCVKEDCKAPDGFDFMQHAVDWFERHKIAIIGIDVDVREIYVEPHFNLEMRRLDNAHRKVDLYWLKDKFHCRFKQVKEGEEWVLWERFSYQDQVVTW